MRQKSLQPLEYSRTTFWTALCFSLRLLSNVTTIILVWNVPNIFPLSFSSRILSNVLLNLYNECENTKIRSVCGIQCYSQPETRVCRCGEGASVGRRESDTCIPFMKNWIILFELHACLTPIEAPRLLHAKRLTICTWMDGWQAEVDNRETWFNIG